MTTRMKAYDTIDDDLADQPEPARSTLQAVRKMARELLAALLTARVEAVRARR